MIETIVTLSFVNENYPRYKNLSQNEYFTKAMSPCPGLHAFLQFFAIFGEIAVFAGHPCTSFTT